MLLLHILLIHRLNLRIYNMSSQWYSVTYSSERWRTVTLMLCLCLKCLCSSVLCGYISAGAKCQILLMMMIRVKSEWLEMVNSKWQNQQENGLCWQFCCWSPLGPTWWLSNMTLFNSTWGARSWLHINTNTCTYGHIHKATFSSAYPTAPGWGWGDAQPHSHHWAV